MFMPNDTLAINIFLGSFMVQNFFKKLKEKKYIFVPNVYVEGHIGH